jgi:hypothetical protein
LATDEESVLRQDALLYSDTPSRKREARLKLTADVRLNSNGSSGAFKKTRRFKEIENELQAGLYGAPCLPGGLQTGAPPLLPESSRGFVSRSDLEPLTSGVRELLERQSLQDQSLKRQDQSLKRLQSDVDQIIQALAIRS